MHQKYLGNCKYVQNSTIKTIKHYREIVKMTSFYREVPCLGLIKLNIVKMSVFPN